MANKLKLAPQSQSRSDETLLQWLPADDALEAELETPVSISGTRDAAAPGEASLGGGPYEGNIEATASVVPPLLTGGDIIGERYVIEEHISAGSFGAVYRASDRQIQNHQVALKLLHAPAPDEPAREAALRELTLIASVSHPSIVQFKDYGWHEGRLWFAMPWYQGETLAARYQRPDGPVPMSRVAARPIFERLAQGLAAMHDVGIHHHDIKPENIFLADIAGFDGGFPVLLDLGIATKRGEGPKGLTVEYASPETAAAALGVNEKPIGAAADAFSLALVLRNLLDPAGAPPQDGEFLALLNQRATVPIKPSKRRDLRHMRATFARWLSLDPDARPTAVAMAAELQLLTQPEDRRQARARILRRVVPIVVAAALAVAVLLWQVREQKTVILVQRERLSQEMQETEQLRRHSAEQLQQIEAKSEQIGTQAQRLQRAIAIGRQLNDQLVKAEDRSESLTVKLRKTSDERNALITERDGLGRERAELQKTRDQLLRERDDLTGARDALAKERDALTKERDQLTAQHEQAIAERDAEIGQREQVASDLGAAKKELKRMTAERDELRTDQKQLKRENKDLRKQIKKLETKRTPPAPPAPAPAADLE